MLQIVEDFDYPDNICMVLLSKRIAHMRQVNATKPKEMKFGACNIGTPAVTERFWSG